MQRIQVVRPGKAECLVAFDIEYDRGAHWVLPTALAIDTVTGIKRRSRFRWNLQVIQFPIHIQTALTILLNKHHMVPFPIIRLGGGIDVANRRPAALTDVEINRSAGPAVVGPDVEQRSVVGRVTLRKEPQIILPVPVHL